MQTHLSLASGSIILNISLEMIPNTFRKDKVISEAGRLCISTPDQAMRVLGIGVMLNGSEGAIQAGNITSVTTTLPSQIPLSHYSSSDILEAFTSKIKEKVKLKGRDKTLAMKDVHESYQVVDMLISTMCPPDSEESSRVQEQVQSLRQGSRAAGTVHRGY